MLTKKKLDYIFQSTPSAWRETHTYDPRGILFTISIHSLRVEGDTTRRTSPVCVNDFNPLPPRGGRRRTPLTNFTHD